MQEITFLFKVRAMFKNNVKNKRQSLWIAFYWSYNNIVY